MEDPMRPLKISLLVVAAAGTLTAAFTIMPAPQSATATTTSSQSRCIAHHPQEYVWYTVRCTGHDEPEIDPLSSRSGSAQDLTWTIVLPGNGVSRSTR